MSKQKHETTALPTVKVVGEVTTAAENDYSAYENQGFEHHTRADYAIPFLGVLQSNSPQIETIANARPGMLINTVTNDLYDAKKGILFVPVETQHVMTEWKPRDAGGGFVKQHSMDADIVKKVTSEQEFGKYKVVKGDLKSNDLIETFYVYGLAVDEFTGAPQQMIIAFSSTKIKPYNAWMTKARTVMAPKPGGGFTKLPLFAHRYRITSVPQKNAKGSFHNFLVSWDGEDAASCRLKTTDPVFLEAVEFRKIITSGEAKIAMETQTSAVKDAEVETDTPFK